MVGTQQVKDLRPGIRWVAEKQNENRDRVFEVNQLQ